MKARLALITALCSFLEVVAAAPLGASHTVPLTCTPMPEVETNLRAVISDVAKSAAEGPAEVKVCISSPIKHSSYEFRLIHIWGPIWCNVKEECDTRIAARQAAGKFRVVSPAMVAHIPGTSVSTRHYPGSSHFAIDIGTGQFHWRPVTKDFDFQPAPRIILE